ncbi:MAG: GNAT family N-acetyltransferase [Limisphaerales bacterium]
MVFESLSLVIEMVARKVGIAHEWRLANAGDLNDIQKIGDLIHVELPERPEVFAEKLKLFPEGCFALIRDHQIVGYGFSHPWRLKSIPPFNHFMNDLPPAPNCLFIHDVAILPQARGYGATERLVELIESIAINHRLSYLALVSVYNTPRFWARFGFETVVDAALENDLKSYGASAQYMVRRLN